jgi:hypothetical protein
LRLLLLYFPLRYFNPTLRGARNFFCGAHFLCVHGVGDIYKIYAVGFFNIKLFCAAICAKIGTGCDFAKLHVGFALDIAAFTPCEVKIFFQIHSALGAIALKAV